MGGFEAGEGDLAAGLSGRCPLAACGRQASPARWPAAAAPRWDKIEGRKREEKREGPEFKLNFLKILNRNLKNFEHKSCWEFENLQLLF
jgi:hypothetical protein